VSIDKNTFNVDVVDEMKQAYGDYAMAVIIGRAIPNLYDGLKPAQRRVLTAMKWLNLRPDGKFMKCARVTGETTGKLHPQGGCYGTLVGMTQWWTNNAILINGHGNFGSLTDNAAAERYTECKLTEFTYDALLANSDIWETRPSYDGSFQEPIQFNAKLPQVLLNGAEGIAVGFATRIPNHNLRGIAKALRCLIEGDAKNGAKHLIPDFPTGCEVVKDDGLLEYMQSGHGSFRMRAVCTEEQVDWGKRSKRDALVFNNLPLHVNPEQLGDQVKAALEKGQITMVADVRDETDMSGIRFVVVLKANVSVEQAKAELYRYTSLDTKFSANNMVIEGTKPVQLAPYDILSKWFAWRDESIIRIFKSELDSRRTRLEVIQGLIAAMDMIDDVIDTIKRSKDKATARTNLMKRDFTEVQANAILDMRLSQLTKLDDKALRDEAKEVQARIKELIKLNSSQDLRAQYILEEVEDLATRYGNARRSKVIEPPAEMSVAVVKQGRKNVEVGPKPRYVLVDEKKGILTQERKMSRKSWVVQADDKLIFVCDNGMFVKKPATAKGPLFDGPAKILFRAKTTSLPQDPLLAVYRIDDAVYANAMTWESLTKCTSKGKVWLPEGAELIHIGGSHVVKKAGRKKDIELRVSEVKQRSVGGKGSKVCNVSDLA
jgi:DNA gyrase subunit A